MCWGDRSLENGFFLEADGLRAWRPSANPWTSATWFALGAPFDPRPPGSARLSNSHVGPEDGVASLEQCVPHVVAGQTYQPKVLWFAPGGQPLNPGGAYVYVSVRFFSGPGCEPLTDLGFGAPPGVMTFGPEGNGDWTWNPTILFPAPDGARSLSIALGHGRHANQPAGASVVYFDAALLASGPASFVKGSFDQSGETSLLLRNSATGEHRVWFMRDEQRASFDTISPAVPLAWQAVGVADFDADGWNDLLLWHPSGGLLDFWRLNGITRVGPSLPIAPTDPGPSWRPSATADFDHDGKPDLVLRDPVSQQILIWTLDGMVHVGDITPTPSQAVNVNWEIVGAADMDGDGNTDLLWYNATSGRIVYWLMDASVVRTVGAFTNPMAAGNNNWKVLAMGDYGMGPDATGIAQVNTQDLVWRNATSGRLVVWYMDKAGNRTSGLFSVPPDLPAPVSDWTVAGPR